MTQNINASLINATVNAVIDLLRDLEQKQFGGAVNVIGRLILHPEWKAAADKIVDTTALLLGRQQASVATDAAIEALSSLKDPTDEVPVARQLTETECQQIAWSLTAKQLRAITESLTGAQLTTISENIDVELVAARIDCDEIAARIDNQDIASHIEARDIAEHVDASDIAEHIELGDLAEHINVEEVAEHLSVDDCLERLNVSPQTVAESILEGLDPSEMAERMLVIMQRSKSLTLSISDKQKPSMSMDEALAVKVDPMVQDIIDELDGKSGAEVAK